MRKGMGVPDLDTVFSQARNGRIKRVEESLNLGMIFIYAYFLPFMFNDMSWWVKL